MKLKRIRLPGAIALILALGGAFSGTAGETADTQRDNSRARYVILGAEVDVFLRQGGISNFRRRVILKLDTQTGATSVLQLAQLGVGDPTVTSAVWAPVSESGIFLNNNNLTVKK